MNLYPGSEDWETSLKTVLKKHQAVMLPCEYAGLTPLTEDTYLAVSCDGIGTKILLAKTEEDYFNLGVDNVAMNINDLICSGATPKSFTNILSRAKYNPIREKALLEGMIFACEKFNCVLAAGETADIPDLVHDFDLVGSVSGILNKKDFINPSLSVKEGNYIYGIPSTSPHSNGYTLIRKHFDKMSAKLQTFVKKPTRLYYDLPKMKYNGLAHLTGTGLHKLKRIIPEGLCAHIQWPSLSPEWKELLSVCDISTEQGKTIFNLGIGMVAILDEKIDHASFVLLGRVTSEKDKINVTFSD